MKPKIRILGGLYSANFHGGLDRLTSKARKTNPEAWFDKWDMKKKTTVPSNSFRKRANKIPFPRNLWIPHYPTEQRDAMAQHRRNPSMPSKFEHRQHPQNEALHSQSFVLAPKNHGANLLFLTANIYGITKTRYTCHMSWSVPFCRYQVADKVLESIHQMRESRLSGIRSVGNPKTDTPESATGNWCRMAKQRSAITLHRQCQCQRQNCTSLSLEYQYIDIYIYRSIWCVIIVTAI